MRSLLAASAFLSAVASAAPQASDAPPRAAAFRAPAATAAVAERSRRDVSTAIPGARAAFDDGLTLLYAFDPEEARVAFERAARLDPRFALAWWGVATSYGTNINTAYAPASQRAGRDAIERARTLAPGAPPVERALVDAAAARFAVTDAGGDGRSARAYRDAMGAAASAFPDDDDVQTLAAEAEMDVHPWGYFDAAGTATPGTLGTVARLQRVLARDPGHFGAEHLLIHATEQSRTPELALDAARRLAAYDFEPAAEHLEHMPAHTFERTGDYDAAGRANAKALASYAALLARPHAGHEQYRGHDCVFGIDAFAAAGEYARARAMAAECANDVPEAPAAVDLRFGRTAELARDGDPGPFLRGMRDARAGAAAAAERELAAARKGDAGDVAAPVLEAAIARLRGDRPREIASLERAVAAQDAEPYGEPPAFWWPVRESLGGALYRARRYGDAERVYAACAARDREDPRALDGLAHALEREGRAADAAAARARFAVAWAHADSAPNAGDP